MTRVPALAVSLLWLALQSGASAANVDSGARSGAGLSHLSIEELAEIEVSSVSKRPERLADAPAAVYVITRDEIRRSGVTSLPEALRLAPNLQVARASSNSYAITARGFNSSSANKLLVLIDGRSVYSPLNSGVFWDVQDVMLEDIDRIEVVSGPGGTLWGANAVNGVINIITRSAHDTLGTLASADAGTEERGVALRHGRSLGEDASARLYAKGFRYDHSVTADGNAVADAWDLKQAGFRADWGKNGSGITLLGNAYDGKSQGSGFPDRTVSGANLLARWSRELGDGAGLQAQVYFDRNHRKQPGLFTLDIDTIDVDLQHHFSWGGKHEIVWGGGGRTNRDHTTGGSILAFVPADDTLNLVNVFAQDTVSLSEHVKFTFGSKFERNSHTGLEVQPSARLAWKLDEHGLLWSALSRAVRTPSRVDRALVTPSFNLPPPYSGKLVTGPPFFESEKLTAFELGYRAQPTPQSSFSFSAFYNDYDRLRSLEPAPGGGFLIGNGIAGHASGIEAWGSVQASERWRLSAGLKTLDERLHFKPGSADPGSPYAGANDPHYKLTLQSSVTLPRDIGLDVEVRAIGALHHPDVPSYVALDMRLSWLIRRGVELSLAGFNLGDARHPEFGAAPARSEIARRFSLRLAWAL